MFDFFRALHIPMTFLSCSTPWKRIAKYSVPDLPPCPAAGCICAVRMFWPPLLYHADGLFKSLVRMDTKWVIPSHSSKSINCRLTFDSLRCGEPTLYMQGFRCTVTGSKTNPVRTIKYPAVAPQWCQDDSAQCVAGPKQVCMTADLPLLHVLISHPR